MSFFFHILTVGVYDALFPFVHIFFSFLNILSFFTYTFLFYIYWQSEGKYVEELEDEASQAFLLHFHERLANISGLFFT
jgi:hypothetical protein